MRKRSTKFSEIINRANDVQPKGVVKAGVLRGNVVFPRQTPVNKNKKTRHTNFSSATTPRKSLSIMQLNSWTASIFSLPSDVTQQDIMTFLSRADLVAMLMTCKAMQKIALKRMLSLGRENDISKAQFQAHLLDDIFRVGCFSQLIWFQKSLNIYQKISLTRRNGFLSR